MHVTNIDMSLFFFFLNGSLHAKVLLMLDMQSPK